MTAVRTKKSSKTLSRKSATPTRQRAVVARLKDDIKSLDQRRRSFLARRPHRSFSLTRRREYKRPLRVPGYWSFTMQVFQLLWKNKRTFFALILFFTLLTAVLSSMMSQSAYQQLIDAINNTKDKGLSGAYSIVGLFVGVVASYATGVTATTASQQAANLFVMLFAWLTTIWLVRAFMLGKKPKMRDGLYNSGSPVIAMLMMVVILAVQFIPAAVAIIVYSALNTSGMLQQTIVLMLAGGASVLIVTLSVYWAVSTIVAMIMITLPGAYPLQTLRLSGDIVTGRRIAILLRFFWAFCVIAVVWVAVLVPTIMLDGAIKSAIPAIDWLPIVPFIGLLLVYVTVVIFATYVYMFYREVVKGDSSTT